MNNDKSDYDKVADRYFGLEFRDRTTENLIELLTAAIDEVRANAEDGEPFEDINLNIQQAVKLPEADAMHGYLEAVSEELLGYENLEAVLGNNAEAVKARLDWSNYIETVIAELKSKSSQ